FQAEDGIRDFHVTGVQTCALPIWGTPFRDGAIGEKTEIPASAGMTPVGVVLIVRKQRRPREPARNHPSRPCRRTCRARLRDADRSEERRVGKEWTPRRPREQEKTE